MTNGDYHSGMMKADTPGAKDLSNNQKILEKITDRMAEGNKKFGKEMPLDDTYSEEDILEEVIDTAIYASSLLIHLKKIREK